MQILTNLSNIIIPVLIFYIVGYGVVTRTNVYEDFIVGAKKGIKTVVRIMPTLIALIIAVGVLRASGIFEWMGSALQGVSDTAGVPTQIVPLIFVKMFSSSAATGLILDLFKTYGPDSQIGKIASLLASCTETIFYTMSVYFMAAKVTKTRWTLPGALISTAAGVVASIVLAGWM